MVVSLKYKVIKILIFLKGKQRGYNKYPCDLCLWDSRGETAFMAQADEFRIMLQLRMPPFYVKFGLIKKFLKVSCHGYEVFRY